MRLKGELYKAREAMRENIGFEQYEDYQPGYIQRDRSRGNRQRSAPRTMQELM